MPSPSSAPCSTYCTFILAKFAKIIIRLPSNREGLARAIESVSRNDSLWNSRGVADAILLKVKRLIDRTTRAKKIATGTCARASARQNARAHDFNFTLSHSPEFWIRQLKPSSGRARLCLTTASPLPKFCDVLATVREDRTHPRN